ncbi:MAG: SpoIVB peptidase [Clostridia bacterium]|nr:SpoIVB peptidase [Clostridia bacterium]
MLANKRFTKYLLGIFFILVAAICFSVTPAYAQPDNNLYIGGFSAGFVLNTQNVEVIGTCDIFTEKGAQCPAREGGIKTGDVIKCVNGTEITSANQLTQMLCEDFKVYNLTVKRGSEELEVKLNPIIDANSGKKKLGLLVKDSINGIGTVTYIDKATNTFGSLGHPVANEQGELVSINGGSLYGCTIYDVKRGLRGNPGELKGIFENSEMLGVITSNTKCGIFGDVSPNFDVSKLTKVEKGSVANATMGKAYIYSTLNGSTAEKYEINIVKVDPTNKDNRNYVIKITDKRVLDKSGGIVQGMSGSPIIQNGKLIGAVTHVFVNDPTRGYGISIDNMLSSY